MGSLENEHAEFLPHQGMTHKEAKALLESHKDLCQALMMLTDYLVDSEALRNKLSGLCIGSTVELEEKLGLSDYLEVNDE